MGNKAFLKLVIGTLVVGVGLGVAVIGVVALGDSNGSETVQSNPPSATASGAGTGTRIDQGSEEEPTREVQSDETEQETPVPDQRPFQGQFGQGFGGLTGTIEEVEGATLTVITLDGPLQATVGEDTVIQMFAEGTLADLEAGMTATLVSQRAQDGTVFATSISILPEGGEGFPGGGGLAGRPGINPDDQEELNQLRQRIQSGEITQEELAELRQQFQGGRGAPGQFGQGGPGGQGFGGGGLTGTIESIEGGRITLNTSQGPLQATVGEETTIQMLAQGALDDLEAGVQITVIGPLGEDGSVQAVSLFIAPEDGEGFFGDGTRDGRGLPGGRENP